MTWLSGLVTVLLWAAAAKNSNTTARSLRSDKERRPDAAKSTDDRAPLISSTSRRSSKTENLSALDTLIEGTVVLFIVSID